MRTIHMALLTAATTLSACSGYSIPATHDGKDAAVIIVRENVAAGPTTHSRTAQLIPALHALFIERASATCPQGYEIVDGPSTGFASISSGSSGFPIPGLKAANGRATIVCNNSGETPVAQPAPPKDAPVTVTVQDVVFIVEAAVDRTFAIVSWPQSQRTSALMMEAAAILATGCDAVKAAGVLSMIPSATNLTALPIIPPRVRVETYCPGDTRPRARGLPDALGLGPVYPTYPEKNRTYLTYSHPHGFQVTHLGNSGRSWLWYPGNNRAVAGEWKVDESDICFRHPEGTFNPVTRRSGGAFECRPLAIDRRIVVAELAGDPFRLKSGGVPYQRARCDAPDEFQFDRDGRQCHATAR